MLAAEMKHSIRVCVGPRSRYRRSGTGCVARYVEVEQSAESVQGWQCSRRLIICHWKLIKLGREGEEAVEIKTGVGRIHRCWIAIGRLDIRRK